MTHLDPVIIEIFDDGVAEELVSEDLPGHDIVEVYETPPDTHYQVGGSNPTANPNILVWYDTQGA